MRTRVLHILILIKDCDQGKDNEDTTDLNLKTRKWCQGSRGSNVHQSVHQTIEQNTKQYTPDIIKKHSPWWRSDLRTKKRQIAPSSVLKQCAFIIVRMYALLGTRVAETYSKPVYVLET